MNTALRARRRYQEDSILAAGPERLVTMLYDRLLQDIDRAEAAQRAGHWPEANEQLQHAQSIVAELQSSLADTWEGSAGLRSLYAFLSVELVRANIGRDPERTHACSQIVSPLREAWHGAADSLAGAAS